MQAYIEETIHIAEINDTSYEWAACFHWDEAKKNLEQKIIFQLRQCSIFFDEKFMEWSLG